MISRLFIRYLRPIQMTDIIASLIRVLKKIFHMCRIQDGSIIQFIEIISYQIFYEI